MEYLVVADTDGTLYGIWSDELIDVYEIEKGQVAVERASHVEFCKGCNVWHVYEPDGIEIMEHARQPFFRTRALALAWEKHEIERRLQEETIKWTF